MFSQQVLKKGQRHSFEQDNPWKGILSVDDVASVGYRYRQWDLGNNITLVVRTEVHAAIDKGPDNPPAFACIRALNEYDPKSAGVDWRLQLGTQRGTVLATELKNNSHKLSKWTAQALLAGAQAIKLGYVSRTAVRDRTHHSILSVQTYTPAEFASLLGLSSANMWGILRFYLKVCLKVCQGNGTYVLLKDPYKGLVRMYHVPDDAFEKEDNEEEEQDEAEEDADEEGQEEDVKVVS